jgi:hypothetical protein
LKKIWNVSILILILIAAAKTQLTMKIIQIIEIVIIILVIFEHLLKLYFIFNKMNNYFFKFIIIYKLFFFVSYIIIYFIDIEHKYCLYNKFDIIIIFIYFKIMKKIKLPC